MHEATDHESITSPPLEGMLVHRGVTPSSVSLVPIDTPGCRETMWVKFLV